MCRQNRFLFSFGKIPFVFVFSSSLSNRVFRVYYFLIFRVSTKLLSLFFLFFLFLSLSREKKDIKKNQEEARFCFERPLYSGTLTSRERARARARERHPRASRESCGERRFCLFLFFVCFEERRAFCLFFLCLGIESERAIGQPKRKARPLFLSFVSCRVV